MDQSNLWVLTCRTRMARWSESWGVQSKLCQCKSEVTGFGAERGIPTELESFTQRASRHRQVPAVLRSYLSFVSVKNN